jgi:hypothetical protein
MKSALAGQLRYQSFDKGAIFFTETFGAVLLDSVLFAKWSRLGSTLQNKMGRRSPMRRASSSGAAAPSGSRRSREVRSRYVAVSHSRCTAGSTSAGAR